MSLLDHCWYLALAQQLARSISEYLKRATNEYQLYILPSSNGSLVSDNNYYYLAHLWRYLHPGMWVCCHNCCLDICQTSRCRDWTLYLRMKSLIILLILLLLTSCMEVSLVVIAMVTGLGKLSGCVAECWMLDWQPYNTWVLSSNESLKTKENRGLNWRTNPKYKHKSPLLQNPNRTGVHSHVVRLSPSSGNQT